jgi:hypothetical protein
MADHVAVVTEDWRGICVAIARRPGRARPTARLDTSFLPAWAQAHQRNVMASAPWSLHLADGRGRVGPAAALGPEGGRLAPLSQRPGGPAGRARSGRRQ